ncbi:unnamed protein product [Spirodela intermedia]|uniref:S1 motif domain-containing protein n=1 Tax=Spirodela intermedia TaxID=51605 RepID=A0A7I8J8E1_SPIIN|nr:unnamed protein product [Spirodela intermedia]CAA6666005.1 unnamed protein product [Spirodela intermedia]
MHEARYPETDMAAMIRVKNITDMGGVRAPLLEYDRTEGMIPFSELSPSRIRSVSSFIKVVRREPVIVLRIDREKGYIELSKRKVRGVLQREQACPLHRASRRRDRAARS